MFDVCFFEQGSEFNRFMRSQKKIDTGEFYRFEVAE